ncbi:MAG: ATP-binding cassette domain-containing protein [Myxococcaceae bacterium]|nr:ATP-binding cassette domain-containing protein [Myxococcaceae bacterium]
MSNAPLIFEGVRKRFGQGPWVIDGLSAEIPLEGLTFVVGRSGEGKSVLCRLAVGLLKPDAGEVSLLGQPVHQMPEGALSLLRAQTPYLVQGPALLDWLTLEENVALGLPASEAKARAQEALRALSLEAWSERLPHHVSPALQKRVAIARALARQPKYLLMDEPTTGLDLEAAAQVHQAVLELKRQGLGALIVSHDWNAVRHLADRVLELKSGAVAFLGSARSFFAQREK